MDLKEKYIKEESITKLQNGLLSVNDKYYFCTFKEIDKYNENRYVFQKFNIIEFLNDRQNEIYDEIKNYIEKFELTVIEDSTYDIKKVILL